MLRPWYFLFTTKPKSILLKCIGLEWRSPSLLPEAIAFFIPD
ncbi:MULTISPECIES: hypothetical protein [Cyanophyceae]|nr:MULTISPECIES: hypothetical protein [Cyanophyceae]